MAYYALLGGKSIPYSKNFVLEEKIFSYLNLMPHQILFFPQAAYKDIDGAIQKFKALVPSTYKIEVGYEEDLEEELLKKMEASDVLYFGGGCAEELVSWMRKQNLHRLLHKFKDTRKLFMGISAGAILFASYGMGDHYSYKNAGHIYNYQMIEGLGILPITLCPHYDHDGMDCYNHQVKAYDMDGYALEDDTAILFAESPAVFKINRFKSVYYFDSKREYLMIPLYEVMK